VQGVFEEILVWSMMDSTKTWTLDWTMDWTQDSIMDSMFGLIHQGAEVMPKYSAAKY